MFVKFRPNFSAELSATMTQVLGVVPTAISESAQIGVREFKCDYCGKNYSSANSLKTHIKWHTGDLKHKCSYCDKKFRNHSELRRHEMVHTGNIYDNNKNVIKLLDPLLTFSLRLLRQTDGEHIKSRIIYIIIAIGT